jgi:hypothetical protein
LTKRKKRERERKEREREKKKREKEKRKKGRETFDVNVNFVSKRTVRRCSVIFKLHVSL